MVQKMPSNRYSDVELEEFKSLIENKLAKSTLDYDFMRAQIIDLTEAKDNDSDWMDDTSTGNEIELLSGMISRLKKHIQDLEFALVRIKNKTYGVCIVTGVLIDKRRLMAVPATTKSLAGKQQVNLAPQKKSVEDLAKRRKKVSSEPKIISKVIRKPSSTSSVAKPIEDDELDDYDDMYGDAIYDNMDLPE